MKVYALVGKSGTGKSHHSLSVARDNGIDYIIDDGLLIADNRIIAGRSAKRAATKVASVRTAIFSEADHVLEVRNAIRDNQAESLLIIGTSNKMVARIAEALQVAPIEKIIQIEDVSTPEERAVAYEMRNKQGKHVIPVPTFELKKQFSGYFIDPLNLLFKKKGQTIMEEKTVMRPSYSYLGEYKISPKAISDICTYEAMQFSFIHRVLRMKNDSTPDGQLILDIDVSMYFPCRVSQKAALVARRIQEAIEEFTSINVRKVNINVKALQMKNAE
ncbi:MAG: Asp23/Gls24 family envelope stress response protein [Clostridia bacterium]|nr:Asp23/Gls24 family envelope stress response protein [Clostridia bacterium]